MQVHRLLMILFLFSRENCQASRGLAGLNEEYLISYGFVEINGEFMVLTQKGKEVAIKLTQYFEEWCQ